MMSVKNARLSRALHILVGKHLKRALSVGILIAGNAKFMVLLKTTLI
jgi:hypothetical protein